MYAPECSGMMTAYSIVKASHEYSQASPHSPPYIRPLDPKGYKQPPMSGLYAPECSGMLTAYSIVKASHEYSQASSHSPPYIRPLESQRV